MTGGGSSQWCRPLNSDVSVSRCWQLPRASSGPSTGVPSPTQSAVLSDFAGTSSPSLSGFPVPSVSSWPTPPFSFVPAPSFQLPSVAPAFASVSLVPSRSPRPSYAVVRALPVWLPQLLVCKKKKLITKLINYLLLSICSDIHPLSGKAHKQDIGFICNIPDTLKIKPLSIKWAISIQATSKYPPTSYIIM